MCNLNNLYFNICSIMLSNTEKYVLVDLKHFDTVYIVTN